MPKKHKISEKKIQNVKILAGLIEKYKTVMIGTTMNLASAQLQKARKMLRGKAEVKYAKKSTALRALDASKKDGVKKLKENVTESPALIFTNEDPFDLAVMLSENKFPARAKAGQIAPKDIGVEAGPTDLPPGPVISEFGAVGVKAGIVGGKIAIKEGKIIAKEGEAITSAVANILTKLDIMPFEVGLDAQAAYDSTNDKIFTGIKIDKAGTLLQLQETFSTSYQFAIHVGYPTSENISQIIINAGREANALQEVVDESKPTEEKPAEEKKEESKEESAVEQPAAEEKKEEPTQESSSTPPEGAKQ
ncbi:50S ribosomal protein L10 [Nanoarchaeota archaeon]